MVDWNVKVVPVGPLQMNAVLLTAPEGPRGPEAILIDPGDEPEKLDALIKVLYDRPALKLEISGYADPAGDTPAYADLLFQRKLQTQKALELADDGQEAGRDVGCRDEPRHEDPVPIGNSHRVSHE